MLQRSALVCIVLIFVILTVSLVHAAATRAVSSPFRYSFSVDGILYETGTLEDSSSPYFWLNSGAKLIISKGIGKTVRGDLLKNERWRLIYALSNPLDSDEGYHPQNIFRLLTRTHWQNIEEIAYFKITKDQLSLSPNRAPHNGLLLMSRFQDGNNLYYSGIRVDGNAIIKKKINEGYYTLASKKIFPGTYDRLTHPNLLPHDTWIGLKTRVMNENGFVRIKLYMDKDRTGTWTLIAEATDSGTEGKPLLNEGYAGIRTDFMDVEFDDFQVIAV